MTRYEGCSLGSILLAESTPPVRKLLNEFFSLQRRNLNEEEYKRYKELADELWELGVMSRAYEIADKAGLSFGSYEWKKKKV